MKRWIGVVASLLLIGFIYQTEGVTWTIEKVTDNTEDDWFPFLTTDPAGVHMVYNHNDGDWEAFYATNASGPWQSSRITDNTRNDAGMDIAVKAGNIHIALMWQDTPDVEISYCKGKPGSWSIERVTDNGDDDGGPSMIIDKNGYAHMAYMKNTGGDYEIFYANNVTGSWKEEQVTDNGVDDAYPSLALDKAGNPHIAFVRIAPGPTIAIFYLKKVAGVWQEEKVVDIPPPGTMTFPMLNLDSNDYAHLAYAKFDGTDNEIYYTNNATGSWQESKVTSNDFDDALPTLALDPQDKAHIVYLTDEGGADVEIFYANNTAGVWDIGRVTDNSVDDHAYYGRYFALDNHGFGHIAFWNDSDGDDEIYYAKSNEPLFTGIEEKGVALPKTFLKVYPNPSKGFSVISYHLPAKSRADIGIYDATGRLIKNFRAEPGSHRVIWHTDNLPSGVYFCRLTTKGFSTTQKVIVK